MSRIILCADDSRTMQTVAEITFRASDFTYVGAHNADEALQKARSQKPTMILADAVMSGQTGYELCLAVKSDPELADVPVIMMCGNSSAYSAEKGSEVGADGHVTKPWDTQVMLDKVEELLHKTAASGIARPKGAPAPEPAAKVQPRKPILPGALPASSAPAGKAGSPQAVAASRTQTLMGMSMNPTPAKGGGKANPLQVPDPKPLGPPLPLRTNPAEPAKAPAGRGGRVAPLKPVPAEARPTPGLAAPRKAQPIAQPAPAAPAVAPAGAGTARPSQPQVVAPPTAAPTPAKRTTTGGLNRPPMIRGTPARRAAESAPAGAATGNHAQAVRAAVASRMEKAVPEAAAAVAKEAGLDPQGPEMRALLALSKDVVERIVWEVVPELAETIIRENLEQLVKR